jgi:hypothetical protein
VRGETQLMPRSNRQGNCAKPDADATAYWSASVRMNLPVGITWSKEAQPASRVTSHRCHSLVSPA